MSPEPDTGEEVGLDVTLAVIQGMTSLNHAITDSLIDSLEYDANRYHVLYAAICDLADQVDSRRQAEQLYSLASWVHDLTREQAKHVREGARLSLFDGDGPRVNLPKRLDY